MIQMYESCGFLSSEEQAWFYFCISYKKWGRTAYKLRNKSLNGIK